MPFFALLAVSGTAACSLRLFFSRDALIWDHSSHKSGFLPEKSGKSSPQAIQCVLYRKDAPYASIILRNMQKKKSALPEQSAFGQNVSPQKPCESNYNLHERAGGLPLCCFSASNVHHRSEPWAGGLQSTAKVPASPEYNVGLSGPVTHPAGTRLLRSHILLWAAEAAFMPPALPRPRRSDPSAHCRPPQALRRLQWPQGIPRRFPPRT